MSIHTQRHPLAGQTVQILSGELSGSDYRIEDWWDRIAGKSWMVCDGNPACMDYGFRSGIEGKPADNEVLYGKVGMFGKLVHISDIALPTVTA